MLTGIKYGAIDSDVNVSSKGGDTPTFRLTQNDCWCILLGLTAIGAFVYAIAYCGDMQCASSAEGQGDCGTEGYSPIEGCDVGSYNGTAEVHGLCETAMNPVDPKTNARLDTRCHFLRFMLNGLEPFVRPLQDYGYDVSFMLGAFINAVAKDLPVARNWASLSPCLAFFNNSLSDYENVNMALAAFKGCGF